jgi:opacity protein-like surface antigen
MKVIVAWALAAFAPLALAQGSPYVSANYGEATYGVGCATAFACDDKDQAYKLALGWQFNRYLAAELAYNDLGQADFDAPGFGAYLHPTGYELAALGTYPLGESIFSLLARLGFVYGKTKYGRDLEGEQTSTSLTYGAGLQLDFTRNVAVRLQWQRFDMKARIDSQSGAAPAAAPEASGEVDVLSFGILLRAR